MFRDRTASAPFPFAIERREHPRPGHGVVFPPPLPMRVCSWTILLGSLAMWAVAYGVARAAIGCLV